MAVAPSAVIDLPLKALAWQDETGKVWLSYNEPAFIARRHGIPADLMNPIAGAAALIELALQ